MLKVLFAAEVSFRGFHGRVAKKKLNLFELTSASVAETGATAAWVVGCQMVDAGLFSTTFHRLPDQLAVTPASCRVPFLNICLNTFPSPRPLKHGRLSETRLSLSDADGLSETEDNIHIGHWSEQ